VAYQIFFTEDSLVELESLLDYIRADNPTAARRFGTALLNHVELLQHFPRLGASVRARRGIRKLFHSPIRVYYRLDAKNELIEILHFWHGSRQTPRL
jgi:plasmid stabilization system protein ParE